MGHHDEIVFGDAHFPGGNSSNVIRADGVEINALLDGVLPLFVLDHAVDHPVIMMEPVGKSLLPNSWKNTIKFTRLR